MKRRKLISLASAGVGLGMGIGVHDLLTPAAVKAQILSDGQTHRPFPGSGRSMLPGASQIGPIDANESIQVSLYLKSRSATSPMAQMADQSLLERQYLSRREFADQYGADPAAIAQVEAFAQDYGLTVVETNASRRVVVLAGTAATMNAAFGVELNRYEHPDGAYRGHSGQVQVPADLIPLLDGVLGLDNRSQARAHIRGRRGQTTPQTTPKATPLPYYTPPQVAQLYNFPPNLTGKGQSIAIIELGGGYRSSDLTTYFSTIGVPLPQVVSVLVDRARNRPSNANSADGEVDLDIQVAGSIAPGAQIVVYFAPNTDRGFLDAITTAIHDTQHNPSVISISWGGSESTWTTQAIQAMDQAFQSAAALGVTICCAVGDNGSTDGLTDGLAHADFPASSPNVLACGGTQLASANGQITSEVVWSDPNGGATGGGVSDVFGLPTWQVAAGVPPSINPGGRIGRGIPDVAGNADPNSGYQIQIDGQLEVIGGTSAVAPLWAGLLALINQQLGKPVGYLNPLLYQQVVQTGALRDITSGNNGGYSATTGWDACTGLGSPDGTKILNALMGKS